MLLGSSTFARFDAARLSPLTLNLAMHGDTAARLAERLPHYRSLTSASMILLNIGFNDVVKACAPLDERLWAQLIAGLPPSVPLVVVGLQGSPNSEHGIRCGPLLGQHISRSNEMIASSCAARPGCTYVANPVSPDGPSEGSGLQLSDGIHLSAKGYEVLIGVLRPTLTQGDLPARP